MAETVIEFKKPRLFQNLEELEAAIEAYFKDCRDRGVPYTVSGLAVTLKTSRRTLLNIQQQDYYPNEFKDLINTAKARILQQTEEGMLGGRFNAAGSIFTLKNNFGYVDKIESSVTVKSEPADILEHRRIKAIEAARIKVIELNKETEG